MSSSMITLSVVIYIIFLLTSTSLFVVACQKNPTKKECPTVVPVKSDLVTVENKYFGIKGGMKVKIIFLFYNPGELMLLPSSTKRKEILESASRLTTVLEDADVLKYLI